MRTGFDYGTSHCSIGTHDPSGNVILAPLEVESRHIPSTLWAPRVNLGFRHDAEDRLDLTANSFKDLKFGEVALQAYLADPTEGYFVKSPKSFLGAPGLSDEVKTRFVSIVAAMMANVRQKAEAAFHAPPEQVVIGRPVNFQGPSGRTENSQALEMLHAAAREAGFVDVEFLFEPMAAAMEYESKLSDERLVLVVDVGGGTTDCSFVRVGPRRAAQSDRSQDVLGHSGERLGGNDYDQALALKSVMPALGLGSELRNGLPVPNNYLVDAVSTNDVNAQQRFYSKDTGERIDYFLQESTQPQCIERLYRLRAGKGTYRLLRQVELGKIELSDSLQALVDLGFIEPDFSAPVEREDFADASERLLQRLGALIDEVVNQSGTQPDVVYLTGGMARATIVREHLQQVLGDVPHVDSDHFASVTEGLTLHAQRIFGG